MRAASVWLDEYFACCRQRCRQRCRRRRRRNNGQAVIPLSFSAPERNQIQNATLSHHRFGFNFA